MKISYSWLKDYIEISRKPRALADILTMSGSEVKSMSREGNDVVFDIEVTPNRSDCLSYLGIAREISALTSKRITLPRMTCTTPKKCRRAPVAINAKNLCPRYTARLITDVRVGHSPQWLKKKITAMGLRPVNNVVDILNYILFETGQPMHAFDYDRLDGGKVAVRRARAGEKIILINNAQKELTPDMLVIADARRPVALAGIMGGLETEVGIGTKNILLESALFDPVTVRRTAHALALSSESSYRFERGVDPAMVSRASDRACLLIRELCGGRIQGVTDAGARRPKKRRLAMRLERMREVLNVSLSEPQVRRILSSLGIVPSGRQKKGVLSVAIPSYRDDICAEADLVEEVARIYGYSNIEKTIPAVVPKPERKNTLWKTRERIRSYMVSAGFSEVITYALTATALQQRFPGTPADDVITVKNALNSEQEAMRYSLVPGMLAAVARNIHYGSVNLKLFEIGAVYRKSFFSKKTWYEKKAMAFLMTGELPFDWQRTPAMKNTALTLFDQKGVLAGALESLGLDASLIRIGSAPAHREDAGMPEIRYRDKAIGFFTSLRRGFLKSCDIDQKVHVAEIILDDIAPCIVLEKSFAVISNYPSVFRDISLMAPRTMPFDVLCAVAYRHGHDLVTRVMLRERYIGEQIESGNQGIFLRLEYQRDDRTLTSDEVDAVHREIRNALSREEGITLR